MDIEENNLMGTQCGAESHVLIDCVVWLIFILDLLDCFSDSILWFYYLGFQYFFRL